MDTKNPKEVRNLEVKNNDESVKDMNNSNSKDFESESSFLDLENNDKEKNKSQTVLNKDCSLEIDKRNSDERPSIKTGALSAIAMDYNSSDSEIEEIIEPENSQVEIINQEKSVEVEILKEYRSHVEITCSSDELDSEEDSSSSDDDSEDSSESESSSDSSENDSNEIKKPERSGKANQRVRKKSKGEFDDLPPIEDLNINVPEVLCDPLGEVAWIVDQMVVVRPKPGKPTLNIDSVLFVERGRRVLGRVFDVFGQVSDPHYCVRFNNSKHIQENNIQVGMNVYFCPNTEYTSVVFLHELSKMKACDPMDDEEIPLFSDDEEEQAYYQNLRKQQKNEKADSESGIPTKKKRTTGHNTTSGKKCSGTRTDWKSHHPWNPRRNLQSQHPTAGNSQQLANPQGSYSQNWYGSMPYQPNHWPPFPVFPNPAWSMYFSPEYRGFRPQMGFPLPLQPPRLSNSMSWNVRNQAPTSQNLQSESLPIADVIALNPPPPPPPPPPNPSPPGL